MRRSQHQNWAGAPALGSLFALVLRLLDKVASWLIIVCMAVLTTVIFIQVVLRYGFNSSLDWGWEVPRLCFIATVFLAIPLGLERGSHVGIEFLGAFLSGRNKRALALLQATLSIILMLIVAAFALQLSVDLWDQLMPTLDLSVGLFYAVLSFAAVHSILRLLNDAFTNSIKLPQSIIE
jgi:TRAP-type C4-dicarboxylate transport system permease small subunit